MHGSDYLCHLKKVRGEQYSQGHITSSYTCTSGDAGNPWSISAQVAAQVGTGLVKGSPCSSSMQMTGGYPEASLLLSSKASKPSISLFTADEVGAADAASAAGISLTVSLPSTAT